MSPFVFDLVVDSLDKILSKAQDTGLIAGLGNFYDSNKLNLHFVDDTLIFLEASPFMVENFKLLLLGFKSTSGLKINFDKSELIALNINDHLASIIANQLGCKVFTLPITYLGVPLHWKKLSISGY